MYQGMGDAELRNIALEASIRRPNKPWKRVKLRSYTQLPGYLKDNEFILNHYRANFGIRQSLRSLFFLHNESFNIWSHIIGFLIFVALTVSIVCTTSSHIFPTTHVLETKWSQAHSGLATVGQGMHAQLARVSSALNQRAERIHQNLDAISSTGHRAMTQISDNLGTLGTSGQNAMHQLQDRYQHMSSDLYDLSLRLTGLGGSLSNSSVAAWRNIAVSLATVQLAVLTNLHKFHRHVAPTCSGGTESLSGQRWQTNMHTKQLSGPEEPYHELMLPAQPCFATEDEDESLACVLPTLANPEDDWLQQELAHSDAESRGRLLDVKRWAQSSQREEFGYSPGVNSLDSPAVDDSISNDPQCYLAGIGEEESVEHAPDATARQATWRGRLLRYVVQARNTVWRQQGTWFTNAANKAAAGESFTKTIGSIVWSTFKWPTPRWPLYLYLSGVLVCLLCSSLCHLLGNSYRQLVRYIWRVDYAGITYLIVTSFYPLANYVFLCRPFFTYLYTTTITVLGVALLAVTWFEVFQTARFRYIRPGIFAGMGLSGLLPVLQAAVMYRHVPEVRVAVAEDLLMAFFYLFGAALYAARIPERFSPGRFDLWCNSHQIFHVLLVLGAYMHLRSSFRLLNWRDSIGGCAEHVLFPTECPWAQADDGEGEVSKGWNLLDVELVWEYVNRRVWQVMGQHP